MAATKTFPNVTQAIWDCMKSASIAQRGTIYDPGDANQGTATTETPVGKLVLQFDFDPSSASVTYTVVTKPFLVPESAMWSGIQDSINACATGDSSD